MTAGLYTPGFALHAFGHPSGLMLPVVAEEMFWGDGLARSSPGRGAGKIVVTLEEGPA